VPESETREPLPEKIETTPEKKEEAKPDPFAELEAKLTAKFQKEIEARDSEIAALKRPKEQPGPTVVEKIDIYKDLAQKVWEDTPSALRSLRDEIKKEVTSELRGEYRAAKSEEKFWDTFYRENKAFNRDDDHWVVQAIVNENFADWKEMPVAKVRAELAKETEKRLARIEARKERSGDTKSASLNLSSANAPSPRKEPEETLPRGLSDVLKARQAFRQEKQSAFRQRLTEKPRDDRGRYKEMN
jgi:hypothetical protein